MDYRRFFVHSVEFGKLFGLFFLFIFTVQLRGGGYREGGVCMAQVGACTCLACWPTIGGVSTPVVISNGASDFVNGSGYSIQCVAHSFDQFALLLISSLDCSTNCFLPSVDFAFIVDGAPWGCICPFVPDHTIVQFCLSGGLIRQDGGPLYALGVCTASLVSFAVRHELCRSPSTNFMTNFMSFAVRHELCRSPCTSFMTNFMSFAVRHELCRSPRTNFMSIEMCAIVFASPSIGIGIDFISDMQSRDRRAWPWLVASNDLLGMRIMLGPDTNIGLNTNIKINLKIQYFISHSLFDILINSPLYFPPPAYEYFHFT